jgi:hypothetical protein
MATPMYDFCPEWNEDVGGKPKRPLILFAGEATTPYHPSTLHGAFETGIREAYRLDLALEPELNDIRFDESYLYQPTFTFRRGQADIPCKTPALHDKIRNDKKCSSTKRWWFDDDASIMRGVESFGLSESSLSIIRGKMMTQQGDNDFHLEDIKERYDSLMRFISSTHDNVDADEEGHGLQPMLVAHDK